MALVVAVGVTEAGEREVLGLDVGLTENGSCAEARSCWAPRSCERCRNRSSGATRWNPIFTT